MEHIIDHFKEYIDEEIRTTLYKLKDEHGFEDKVDEFFEDEDNELVTQEMIDLLEQLLDLIADKIEEYEEILDK